jgi:adenine-specific DNA-methyltransferase
MDKLKLHSPDFTAQNIEKLAALFPNCVTEARDEHGNLKPGIDFDQLRQELSDHVVEGPRERYHLDWPGKREALLTANAPIAKTLRPCREESVDFENTKNLFIEGDNLDALKLLQETYLGKVKVIYIDPPYNTGKDFIYDDDFKESIEIYFSRSNQKDDSANRMVANTESNGRFHSDWLSMIYARLRLARNLLREDGLIFISIDDNEVISLRMMCDEVFGEGNFCGQLAVVNNLKGRNDRKNVATCHEHLVIYGKSNESSLKGLPLTDEQKAEYKFTDSRGQKYALRDLRKRGRPDRREDRPNMWFPIFYNQNTKKCSLERTVDTEIEITPSKGDGSDGRWRWGRQRVLDNLSILQPRFSTRNNRWDVDHRVYLSDGVADAIEGEDDLDEDAEPLLARSSKTKSFWLGGEISTDVGRRTFKSLFPDAEYDYPKPVELLKRCLHLADSKGGLILDFFSGSATTAQSVMELNAEDQGCRQYVMVQLPETCDPKSVTYKAGFTSIAEIGKERIRRAGAKIKAENATTAPNLDIGFRVLKIDSSNMKDVYYAPDAVKQGDLMAHSDNIKEGRTAEDLLFQVLVDWGVDLTLPICRERMKGELGMMKGGGAAREFEVFFVDGNALAACFEPDITEDLVREIAKRQPLRAVFRDSSFGSDSAKINVEQVFKLLSPGTELRTL